MAAKISWLEPFCFVTEGKKKTFSSWERLSPNSSLNKGQVILNNQQAIRTQRTLMRIISIRIWISHVYLILAEES